MSSTPRWIEHRLAPTDKPKILYEYVVTGSGMFPIDMLRYDDCWPETGEDAAKIEWSFTHRGERKMQSIKLFSHSKPTVDRWASFTWSVGTEKLS